MTVYKPPSYFSPKIGYSTRWLTERASRGEIPGTVKAGAHYRIDVQKFWRWWKDQEVQKWQASTNVGKHTGAVSDIKVRNTDDRLGRLLGL